MSRRILYLLLAPLALSVLASLHACTPSDAAQPAVLSDVVAASAGITLRDRLLAENIVDQPGRVSAQLCDIEATEAIEGATFTTCEMLLIEFRGLTTRAFLFSRGSRQLTLFHEGHNSPDHSALADALMNDARELITALLHFSDVLYFDMPLLGVNSGQTIVLKGRTIHATTHDRFALFDEPGRSALAYFLNPIDLALDQVASRYDRVKMIGRSGGGWSTTLYAALDTRISESISVAGTAPIAVRSIDLDGRDDLGDWEQYGAGIYRWLDYQDLYALASSGGRRHEQLYFEFDNCCFSGQKGEEARKVFETAYGADTSVVFTVLEGATDHYAMPTALLAARLD
jgi:hypothetical protein